MVHTQLAAAADGLVVLACIIAAGCVIILAALIALILLGIKWGRL